MIIKDAKFLFFYWKQEICLGLQGAQLALFMVSFYALLGMVALVFCRLFICSKFAAFSFLSDVFYFFMAKLPVG